MDVVYSAAPSRIELPGGDDHSVVRSFSATVPMRLLASPHDAEIRATFDPRSGDWVIEEFGALRADDGPAVSTESLRQMGVEHTLRQALHSMHEVVTDRDGVDYYETRDALKQALSARKSSGPTPENLRDVATHYRIARILRDSPVMSVELLFDLPSRTATHWIKLARERGHLAD